MMASLSVQPLESSTLFGPKIPEVSKCYREDLTRKSLQRATSQSLPKIKKKTGAKSEKIKLVVNSSESGQRQVVSQPVASTQASLQGSSLPKRLKNLRERRTRVKNRDARFCQVCPYFSESSGSIKYSMPKPDIPTGDRLYHFPQAWQNITTDQWTQSVIRSEFRIQFRVRPKLTRVIPQFQRKSLTDPEKIRLLQQEVESMLEKRAIEPVSSHHPKGGYYSKIFLVQKKSGGWRPLINLFRLNRYILSPHFKMETIDSVRLTLRRNDWAVSVNLKDAYFHIAIHPKSRRYLHFHFMGRTYQFRALQFGLSPATYVFTRVVKTVVKHCRQQGMRLHAYLNDWLQPSISQSLSFQQRDQLLPTVLSLGFVPNWDNSELIPSQTHCFLGARFDLDKGMIGPSLDRILRLQTVIRKMLASHSVSAREIHSLLR